jgi:hypothetical protein
LVFRELDGGASAIDIVKRHAVAPAAVKALIAQYREFRDEVALPAGELAALRAELEGSSSSPTVSCATAPATSANPPAKPRIAVASRRLYPPPHDFFSHGPRVDTLATAPQRRSPGAAKLNPLL